MGSGDDLHTTKDSTRDAVPSITAASKPKRDFFGRLIAVNEVPHNGDAADDARVQGRPESAAGRAKGGDQGRIWVSYHEGFSNAVRKPITLRELMEGF